MWWVLWAVITATLAGLMWWADRDAHARGLLVVLLALLVMQMVKGTPFELLAFAAIWATVAATLILTLNLYIMGAFAALSAAAYFPLWASLLAADIFGLAMLVASLGGLSSESISDSESSLNPAERNIPRHMRSSAIRSTSQEERS